MHDEPYVQTFPIPGTHDCIQMTRAASGQLLRLTGNGRLYLEQRADGRHFDDDLAVMAEQLIGKTLLRQVQTGHGCWLERYGWDADERLCEVDGVHIRRDERSRVIACDDGAEGTWRYHYNEDGPTRIITPTTHRTLRWQDGRLVGVSEPPRHRTLRYCADVRLDAAPVPAGWRRDELGRVWAMTAADGTVRTIFLWDGFACLGRIDGPLGAPLAAVYVLDPTYTPVRMITRHGATRIPRDAFGEGLLAYDEQPGLYGGINWRGLTYLPGRTLDPRTGTFTSPDPYDGLETDPRRWAGYRGPLLTEHPVNRYAIARYDAVGRADPTGNMSWWVYLSDFTWSLQNNLVGWFGLDWTVNFFGSLFSGQIGDFFDYEHLSSSDRLKLTGVRRDGITAPGRAWTFQHLVMVPHRELHFLAEARLIDPQQEFRPTLYGTVLHVDPNGHAPLLLRGTAFRNITNWPDGPVNWSRSGGRAEPVVPGAPLPIFPRGGLHFDQIINRIPEPVEAELRELEARERSVLGTIGLRTVIVIAATGTGLAVDQNVLLTDGANNRGIFRLLSVTTPSGTTRVRVDSDNTGVGPNDVRLRQLGAPDAAEMLSQSTEATHLETQGSARAYQIGNALRLSQGGSVVGAGLIARLEARLALDEALPDPFTQPMVLLSAPASGATVTATRTANANGVEYATGVTLPTVGATLVVRGNGNEVPVVVQTVIGQEVQMDRALTSTGSAGASVQIQPLARGTELGRRTAAREAAAQITYTPPSVRTAPATGFLRLEDNDGRVAVRRIASRVFDAVVFDQPLPGNPANPYDVERFPVSGFDQNGLTISTEQVVALAEVVDIGTPPALLLQQLSGNTVPALLTSNTSLTWTNGTGSVTQQFAGTTAPPAFFAPANALLVDDGSNREVRRIRRLQVSIALDREITVTAGDAANLRAVLVNTTNMPRYQGRIVGPLQLDLPGHALAAGDEVSVDFSPTAATVTTQYRVIQIDAGNTLTANGGQAHNVVVTPTGGSAINGTVRGDVHVAAVPLIGVQPVQMPRLEVEAVIEATWDNVGVPLRVVAVAGDTVTLTDRAAVGADQDLYLKTISFQQMTPTDPGTGTAWAGIHGRAIGGTAVGDQMRTTRLAFDVWTPNGLPKDRSLVVADGVRTLPCRTLASANMDVTIALDLDLATAATPVTLHEPTLSQSGFALDFVREDRAIVIRDNPALVGPTGTDLVLVTPMVPATEAERLATGARIGPGTVLVPQDPENWELDRRQSLIDHELIHTRQSAAWGPLLLAWFPLFALEGLYEGTTDIEQPDYSPYLNAELSTTTTGTAAITSTRFLHIPEPGDISFGKDDQVQLFANGQLRTIKLGNEETANSNRFGVTIGFDVPDGTLRVRKILNDGGWATFRDVIFNIQQVLTHGGVLNILTGSVYGGLFHGVGRLFYAMGRAIFGKGDRFAAQVVMPEKTAITLTRAEDATKLQGANRITVQQGEHTIVRGLSTPASGTTLNLAAALELEGSIFVAPYTTHTPDSAWDWHDYYPAQVPSADAPAAIRVLPASAGKTLTLKPFDRVVVTSDSSSNRTNVTHVRGDGIVELEDVPATSGAERDFRIAKIDEGDPLGNVDSIVLRELGFGWMRWLFDPYGQFQYRLQPANDSAAGIIARIARYLFGTTSWSLLFPFGYYFWDNAFVQSGNNGHFSQMEQEASEESGDLYSPIGRLRGAFTFNKETKRYRGVVGDISRYWYFHGYRTPTLVTAGNRDAPGVHLAESMTVTFTIEDGTTRSGTEGLRVIPDVTDGAATSGDPNQDARASGDTPGLVMPDRFFIKNASAPLATTATMPTGFAPAVAGYVPMSPNLERTFGMYVSFCRAGQHRVTVPNGIFSGADAFNAQEGSSTFGFGRQTIYFNVEVADVEVAVAGQPVAATRTNDGAGNFLPVTIDLVQLQRARVSVTPNGTRRYAITVPHSGRGGQLLTDATTEIVALNRNTPANEPEAVEISRVYRRGADGNYDDAVLNAHRGIHLTSDLHIPVRCFRVRVVNTLPVRRAVTLDAADILDPGASAGKLRPGDSAFIIIPAEPVNTLRLDSVSYPSAPALVTNPDPPRIDPEATPEALQTFVGDGVVTKVTFQPDNPPEATARVTLVVTVGYTDLRANLTAEMEIIPHLTLAPVAGLTVQNNGATLAFNAQDESGAATNLNADSIRLLELDGTTAAGLSATVASATVTITASAAATVGRKQILVAKESDDAHWARRTFEVIA